MKGINFIINRKI